MRHYWSLAPYLILGIFLFGCTRTATPISLQSGSSPNDSSSLPVQATVQLGVISQGASTRFANWIRNQSNRAIHNVTVNTSCECLDVSLAQTTIEAGERVLAHFTYNGGKEPDFVGSLLIEVNLSDRNGQQVGKIDVPIEVISQ